MDKVPEEKWKVLYESQSRAVEALQGEVKRLGGRVIELEQENVRLSRNQTSQDSIIQDTLTKRNKAMNEVLEENQRLRDELRALKNGT